MIFYLSRAAHQYTLRSTLDVAKVEGGPALAPRRQYRLLSYERLFKLRKLPVGSYIFSDLERLDSAATEYANLARRTLAESGRGLVLLNDPLRSMRRFELLRHLHHRGTNAFNLRRLTDADLPGRLPVFIRDEHEHRGSLTPLLHTKEEFEAAVERLLAAGMAREDKLVVEYLDTADAQGLHHRYSALRIGSRILPVCLFFSRKWIIKNRDPTMNEPELTAREHDYLATNPHEAMLRPIFDLARIEFGRIDYAMVDGRPQIFEINTNPSWVRGEDLLATLPEIESRAENGRPIPIAFERQAAWCEQRDLYYWYHRLLHHLRILRARMGYTAKNSYPDSRVQVSCSELPGPPAGGSSNRHGQR